MKRLLKFVPFLFLLIACEENLLKPTQSGSNTFACKLNGKTWIADAGSGFNTKKVGLLYGYFYPPQKQLTIFANRIADGDNTTIQLALEDVKVRGTHYFSFDTGPAPDQMRFQDHAMYRESKPSNGRYITSSRNTGFFTFTKVDTVNHIIAGVFEFTAESLDGSGQTVRITDGRCLPRTFWRRRC
ncbi:hypothetical protein FVR03_23765 [Pontibacter qinzhouensis]|uniref:Lipoprotein n=1 Tax=Pontibacter qinzhouensis TaxID=2603253 RepID=A0A5C8IGV7_9BACT|nr:hypothetical protein [Pontibacter qinzhouensis]TXK20969.1 hypothetical protein FVR03_23765 [Pontibacter qinzhouensis]